MKRIHLKLAGILAVLFFGSTALNVPESLAQSSKPEIQVVQAANLTKLPLAKEGEEIFEPRGAYRGDPEAAGYISEEWVASGEADGHPYKTVVFVRRPSDPAKFSGTLIVEPLHAASAAPVWIYTSGYQLRSGHATAVVYSQKSPLDTYVRTINADRYGELGIWSEADPADVPSGEGVPGDAAGRQQFFERMRRANILSTPILAQVGAALRTSGPLEGYDLRNILLVGHSQTGGVVTNYILDAHDSVRLPGGAPIFDGFFPSGAPRAPFGPRDVPLVQVLSEGDIGDPTRPGREDRKYRRPDSDEPGDRYRLYELAGTGHMGTRYPPYNNPQTWMQDSTGTSGNITADARINSMPHGAMFSMGLSHLVRWVSEGVTPPRADRIKVGPDGLFKKDEFGNSIGGVRSAQLDVPRLKYYSNPGLKEDGTPARGVVGFEEPLPQEVLQRLYPDRDTYLKAFNKRLEELVREGWLLPEDANEISAEEAQHAFSGDTILNYGPEALNGPFPGVASAFRAKVRPPVILTFPHRARLKLC